MCMNEEERRAQDVPEPITPLISWREREASWGLQIPGGELLLGVCLGASLSNEADYDRESSADETRRLHICQEQLFFCT